jgi:hypothetical protein
MMSRLWAYVRPHLARPGIVVSGCGCRFTRSSHARSYRPDFDTVLRASTTPTVAIPFAGFNSHCRHQRHNLLVILVAATAVKAFAEYGSINTTTTYLGQAVVRDLRNDLFEKVLYQPLRFFGFNPMAS